MWQNSEAVREGSTRTLKIEQRRDGGKYEAKAKAEAKYETKGTRTIPLRSNKLYESKKASKRAKQETVKRIN